MYRIMSCQSEKGEGSTAESKQPRDRPAEIGRKWAGTRGERLR